MVPVLLLTGFLGSGKTTLLNRLMNARPDSAGRMAIVVNEFGAVGIDGDLLPEGMTRQVELPGGCICCVMNEDLDKTLIELLDSYPDLRTIVIETTGIAEPLPISWSLAAEPLCERVRLAAVITVVDATEHERHRPVSPSVDAQVEYADLLVISKVDLLPAHAPPTPFVDSLRRLNAHAPILYGEPDDIAVRLWTATADPAAGARGVVAQPADAARGDHHDLESISLPIDQTLDFEELAASLEDLPANYLRIKGIALVVDEAAGSAEPHLVAFHRVGARVSSEPLSRSAETRVVALGRDLEPARLAACLEAAVVPFESQGGVRPAVE